MAIYLEDLEIGAIDEFGAHTVSEDQILDFGRRYDPQPFHVDPDLARRSPYGGLIASGWHTAAVCMRLMVDYFTARDLQSLGSPGVDELRWLRPVRPGDTLRVRWQILEARPSRSRPEMGSVRVAVACINQRDEEVMTMTSLGMVRRRPRP